MGFFIKTKEEVYQKGVDACKKKDYQKAMKHLQKSAEMGYADAWYMIGRMHQYGQGVPENKEKALEYYNKAASLGSSSGKEWADSLHAEIIGVKGFLLFKERKWEESRAIWLEMIEKYDTAVAHYNLGIMYEEGLACEKNLEEARKCFQKCAETREESAVKKMIFYSKSEEEKFYWTIKLAETGDAKAMLELIEAYIFGTDVEDKDFDEADKWLDIMYTEVIDKYDEELEQEDWDIYVRYNYLYSIFLREHPTNKNLELALEVLQASGHDPLCRFEIAKMHFYGTCGLDEDKPRALKRIHKLAEEGFEPAIAFLSEQDDAYRYYKNGLNAIKKGNTEKAIELFETAFEARMESKPVNKAEICLQLGKLYKEKEEYKIAIEWFEKAKGYGQTSITRSAAANISAINKKMKETNE